MYVNPRVQALQERNRELAAAALPLVMDPAERTVLPSSFFKDSLRPGKYDKSLRPPLLIEQPTFKPAVPMQPTRIDFALEPSEEMERVDFFIPEEPAIWEAWAIARVKREAIDAELSGFSECVVLEGYSANIRRVSHSTRRVMESQDRLFRFAVDHSVNTPDPDLPPDRVPVRVEAADHMANQIREVSADARSRGVNQRTYTKQEERGTRFYVPWTYVGGLCSALALLGLAHFMHLT